MDKDPYELLPEEMVKLPQACSSVHEALEAIDADRDFVQKYSEMDDNQIEGYF